MIEKNKLLLRILFPHRVKYFCEKGKNSFTQPDKNLESELKKIIKEEEEESAQDKYKEFNQIIKDQEAMRRKEDFDVYNLIQNSKIPFKDIQKLVLQRNFFKKKKETKFELQEDKDMKDELDNLNLEILDKLNIKEPVALFEMDLETFATYKNLDSMLKLYSLITILLNSAFCFNFNFLFLHTKFAYYSCYLGNSLMFIFLLLNQKIKNKVLALEYLHEEKAIRVTQWRKFSTGKIVKKYSVSDLEMVYCKKIFEHGVNLRSKTSKKELLWLSSLEDEGIWHNKVLFENLFGKIEEEKEDYFKDSEYL